jgi:hypothetical protein
VHDPLLADQYTVTIMKLVSGISVAALLLGEVDYG